MSKGSYDVLIEGLSYTDREIVRKIAGVFKRHGGKMDFKNNDHHGRELAARVRGQVRCIDRLVSKDKRAQKHAVLRCLRYLEDHDQLVYNKSSRRWTLKRDFIRRQHAESVRLSKQRKKAQKQVAVKPSFQRGLRHAA